MATCTRTSSCLDDSEPEPILISSPAKPADSEACEELPDFDFVERPSEDFFCPVTFELLLDPHQTACCGNHLSEKAVRRLQRDGKPCPMCKEPQLDTVRDKFHRRRVNGVRIYCPNKADGCKWIGEVGKKHWLSCPKRPWKCQHCEVVSTFDTKATHLMNCMHYPTACPNLCNIGTIPRSKVDEHLTVCPLEIVQCGFTDIGCTIKLTRQEMKRHMEENLQQHLLAASRLNLKLCREMIAEKESQITEKDRQLAEKDRQLGEKDRLLGEKDRQLAEKDRLLGEKDHQLAEKDRLLGEKDRQLAEKDRLLDEKNRQLAEKDKQALAELQKILQTSLDQIKHGVDLLVGGTKQKVITLGLEEEGAEEEIGLRLKEPESSEEERREGRRRFKGRRAILTGRGLGTRRGGGKEISLGLEEESAEEEIGLRLKEPESSEKEERREGRRRFRGRRAILIGRGLGTRRGGGRGGKEISLGLEEESSEEVMGPGLEEPESSEEEEEGREGGLGAIRVARGVRRGEERRAIVRGGGRGGLGATRVAGGVSLGRGGERRAVVREGERGARGERFQGRWWEQWIY